jgi:predicted Zn-dependent protease with MMP-like domain
MKRMSLRTFGRIVQRVVESLPEDLKPFLDNVVIDVEDEPDPDWLRREGYTEEEIADGAPMYGYFAPMELPGEWSGDVVDLHELPHRIIIFKRPLEDDFPDRRELMLEIRRTVIHELAHHFGYTDRDIDNNPTIEDAPWLFEDDSQPG